MANRQLSSCCKTTTPSMHRLPTGGHGGSCSFTTAREQQIGHPWYNALITTPHPPAPAPPHIPAEKEQPSLQQRVHYWKALPFLRLWSVWLVAIFKFIQNHGYVSSYSPSAAGYPMNPAMAPGLPYPPAMNAAVTPGYYPSVNTNALAPQVAPYPQFAGIPGYEGMSGDGNDGRFLPPPPPFGQGPSNIPAPTNNDWLIPSINQETAKQALLDYANGQCCYGHPQQKRWQLISSGHTTPIGFGWKHLQSRGLCEWVTKPLSVGALDSPDKGNAPQPWEIQVPPPTLFHDESKKMPIPFTTSKKSCQECNGKGKIICQKCNGNSRVKCDDCNGSGNRAGEECPECSGTGSVGCKTCNQTNVQTCPGCNGKGQVMTFIELTVTWKNNVYEFIPDHHSEFPTDLFKKVTGEKMYTDEQFLVPPIMNFPEPSINQASQTAVQQHYSEYMSTARILKQRQSIEWLPLTKVEYSWKGKNCSYFVYGRENKVQTKDYPSTCCCVIL